MGLEYQSEEQADLHLEVERNKTIIQHMHTDTMQPDEKSFKYKNQTINSQNYSRSFYNMVPKSYTFDSRLTKMGTVTYHYLQKPYYHLTVVAQLLM